MFGAVTYFTEISWVKLVQVCTMVMLTTSHTSTTGVLAVLSYATVSRRDMAATGIVSTN